MWLPDTNVWVKYLNSQPTKVKSRLITHRPDQLILCDVVKAELYYGAYKSARPVANVATIDNLVKLFPALSFDAKAARIFGELRLDLNRKGTPIGPYDTQIAAIALAYNCILVTHNTKEFSRVDGLKIEDWE